MELENSQNNALAKLPMLKLGEYEMWEIRIKQYFQIQDYALWEVIENGNSWFLELECQNKDRYSYVQPQRLIGIFFSTRGNLFRIVIVDCGLVRYLMEGAILITVVKEGELIDSQDLELCSIRKLERQR
ncbi:hypothetical protein Tco_1490900 [Tanacetum coccineum]